MDSAIDQRKLEEMLDRAVQEVTEKTAGVRLRLDAQPPHGELCTVHIAFKRGFRSSLSLCADKAMLTRMARTAFRKDVVTAQDLEDFSKEYFNVLCGRVAALLFQATKVPARFSVPVFYRGRFEPEGQKKQFALNYTSDQKEGAQLIHHIPCRRADTTH